MDDVNPIEPPASPAGYERGGQADQLLPYSTLVLLLLVSSQVIED